jgi:hypothetical protein
MHGEHNVKKNIYLRMIDCATTLQNVIYLPVYIAYLWWKAGLRCGTKRTTFIKTEIKKKRKAWREVCIGLKEPSEALGGVYDDGTKTT